MSNHRLFLLLASLTLFFGVYGDSFSESYPPDLKIEAWEGGRMPGSQSEYIVITADGRGKYSKSPGHPGPLLEKLEFKVTTKQLETLWQVIQEEDFFHLDPEYMDKNVFDGSYTVMWITANGKTYTVHLTNTYEKHFEAVLQAINTITPGDRDFSCPFSEEEDARIKSPAVPKWPRGTGIYRKP